MHAGDDELHVENETAEVEGYEVEICLAASVFEGLDEVGGVGGEGHASEEGDHFELLGGMFKCVSMRWWNEMTDGIPRDRTFP